MNRHEDLRHHFEEEMDALRRDTVLLAGLVLENCRTAAEALMENRFDLIDKVTALDDEIDERYSELERRTFLVIATQQPVAGDLRLLVSLTRILYELERCGNLVVNMVQALRRNEGFQLSPQLNGLLARLTRETAELFSRGIDSLADLDATAGLRLEREDDVVDDLVASLYAGLGTEAELHGVETAIQLSRVGRYLERLADHGVNIAQHVTYIVAGEFPGNRKAAD